MTYIKREIEDKIYTFLKTKEILCILGPRQAGKTTVINHCLSTLKNKKINKISFDKREKYNLFENDIELFIIQEIKPYDIVFIDEIQYSKDSGEKLKYIYDSIENVKIIISGSSATELSLQSIKYLVGRITIFELQTLSFKEFLRFKYNPLFEYLDKGSFSQIAINGFNDAINEYIMYGGYPRVIIEENIEIKKQLLKDIYSTYILKEITEILKYKEGFKFEEIVKTLSYQVGAVINYSNLSAKTGIRYSELKEYINVLEKTFIISLLQNYSTNKSNEIQKSPKIYFYDLGLRNVIADEFKIEKVENYGELYENIVYTELMRFSKKVKYWRTNTKAEVDLIVEKGREVIPIEIKTTLNKNTLGKGYISFLDKYSPKIGYILSKEFKNIREYNENKIQFLPYIEFFNNSIYKNSNS